MTNPVPIEYLKGTADIILAIDVAGGPEGEPNVKPGKIDAIYASPQLMQITITNEKARRFQLDALLRPAMGDVRVMDFMHSKSILQKTAYFEDEVKSTIDRLITNFEK